MSTKSISGNLINLYPINCASLIAILNFGTNNKQCYTTNATTVHRFCPLSKFISPFLLVYVYREKYAILVKCHIHYAQLRSKHYHRCKLSQTVLSTGRIQIY